MTTGDRTNLSDLGEFGVLNEVLFPLAHAADRVTQTGDDCAYIDFGEKLLAVSADMGPRPLLDHIPGRQTDFEAGGWLAAVATISDLATAGAEPLFMTSCVDAPPDLSVQDFKEFMSGYFRACSCFGFRNGGGDIRQGATLAARVFGVGVVERSAKIGRRGGEPGDALVVIGPTGRVMSTYLRALAGDPIIVRAGNLTSEAEQILRFPEPRLFDMRRLGSAGLIEAASDTSDGLLGAIQNIVTHSGFGFELRLTQSMLPDYALRAMQSRCLHSPWNLFFCWGDWSVAAVVSSKKLERFLEFCTRESIENLVLGVLTKESTRRAVLDSGCYNVNVVRNENFVCDSYNAGVETHICHMLQTPLFYHD